MSGVSLFLGVLGDIPLLSHLSFHPLDLVRYLHLLSNLLWNIQRPQPVEKVVSGRYERREIALSTICIELALYMIVNVLDPCEMHLIVSRGLVINFCINQSM